LLHESEPTRPDAAQLTSFLATALLRLWHGGADGLVCAPEPGFGVLTVKALPDMRRYVAMRKM